MLLRYMISTIRIIVEIFIIISLRNGKKFKLSVVKWTLIAVDYSWKMAYYNNRKSFTHKKTSNQKYYVTIIPNIIETYMEWRHTVPVSDPIYYFLKIF